MHAILASTIRRHFSDRYSHLCFISEPHYYDLGTCSVFSRHRYQRKIHYNRGENFPRGTLAVQSYFLGRVRLGGGGGGGEGILLKYRHFLMERKGHFSEARDYWMECYSLTITYKVGLRPEKGNLRLLLRLFCLLRDLPSMKLDK